MTCTNPEFSAGEGTPGCWSKVGGGSYGPSDNSLTVLEKEALPVGRLHRPQCQVFQVEVYLLSDIAPRLSDTSEDDSLGQMCLWVEKDNADYCSTIQQGHGFCLDLTSQIWPVMEIGV